MTSSTSPRPVSNHQQARLRAFYEQAERMGVALPRDLFWYHSIELGGGLVTPGVYDLRDKWHHYHFPADFQGQRMLDIGAATGFFSFRFAQSGAEVVATELGDIGGLDRFPGQDLEIVAQKAAKYAQGYVLEPPAVWDAHTLHHLMLEGPFFYCQQVLGLTLERVFSRIYDLSPDTVGRFDWVFIGDVLLHTLRPLEALSAAASVCEGTLVIAQELTALGGDTPLLVYTGGSELDDDESAWWMPNLAWMKQLLHKLGFRTVEVKAVFEDVYLPVGQVLTRTVIHAKR